MSLNSLIISTLKPIGVPVSFMVYEGTAPTYIVFMQYNEFGVLFADDEEVKARHSVHISVYSKGDYTAVVEQVEARMKAAGFLRNNKYDLYENDTKTFHKVIRYFYSN
jgi:hypothetical protein